MIERGSGIKTETLIKDQEQRAGNKAAISMEKSRICNGGGEKE